MVVNLVAKVHVGGTRGSAAQLGHQVLPVPAASRGDIPMPAGVLPSGPVHRREPAGSYRRAQPEPPARGPKGAPALCYAPSLSPGYLFAIFSLSCLPKRATTQGLRAARDFRHPTDIVGEFIAATYERGELVSVRTL